MLLAVFVLVGTSLRASHFQLSHCYPSATPAAILKDAFQIFKYRRIFFSELHKEIKEL